MKNHRKNSQSIAAGSSCRSFDGARKAKGLLGAALSIAALTSPLALHAQTVSLAGVQTTVVNGLSGSVTVNAAGDLFSVAGNNVVELPWTGSGYGTQITVPASGLNSPFGTAVDAAGDLFIADFSNNRVVEVPWTGSGYGAQRTIAASGLNEPAGVAVDAAGDLFIADTYNSRVVELPWTGSGYGAQITVPASGLNGPWGVAMDTAGDLFIADTFNSRVVELPWTGSGFGPQTTVPASGLSDPTGVGVDGAGNLFIADVSNNRVVELPRTGSSYGAQTTIPASGLNLPSGVAVDSKGNRFIADFGNNRLVELQLNSGNAGSANVCPAGKSTPAPCNQTATLNYMIDNSTTIGSVNVVTQGAPNLDFTLSSTTCTGAVTAGSTCTAKVTFAPIAPGQRAGAVQLTDNSGNVLASTLLYGLGQAPALAYGSGTQSTVPAGGLNLPWGVAVDGAGDVFIADNHNNRVVKVSANGGAQTIPASGLNNPQGVAVDGAGDVFIADFYNYRVVELPWTGSGYGAQITLPTNGLSCPEGVAVDGTGDVFIADYFNNRVVELPWTGSGYGAQVTVPASGLSYPVGVAVDGKDNVFITDSGNNRVVELSWTGSGYGAQTTLPTSGLNWPEGLALDAAGDVFILDTANARLVEVPANSGTQITVLASGLNWPEGLALDKAGDLFIADTSNNRVLEIQSSAPPPLTFPATEVGQTSSQSFTVQNIGNQSLTVYGLSLGGPFKQVAGSGTPEDCTHNLSLTPGTTCNLSIGFTPTDIYDVTEFTSLASNSLNGNPAQQSITLNGTGVGATLKITLAWPTPQVIMEVGETLALYGTENGSSKATVACAVQNTSTGLWLQSDMISYASTQYWFPASIYDSNGDWRWLYTPNANGSFLVVAQVTDGGSVTTAQSTYTVITAP
jgi:large repetitive protein